MAKGLIEQRYSDVVDVIYGDTDSVFVKTVEDLSVAHAIKYFPTYAVADIDSERKSPRR
jgi:DNA polymerase elongation subunit (family B)